MLAPCLKASSQNRPHCIYFPSIVFQDGSTHNRSMRKYGEIACTPLALCACLRLMSESIQHACIMYSYPYMIFSTTLLLKSLLTYQHSSSYFNLPHCQSPKTTNFNLPHCQSPKTTNFNLPHCQSPKTTNTLACL